MDTSDQYILFLPEVAARLRVSTTTVRRLLFRRRKGEGTFPLPISQFKEKGRWLASDVDKYIESLSNVNVPVQVPSKKQQEREFQQRLEVARAELRKHGIDHTKKKKLQ